MNDIVRITRPYGLLIATAMVQEKGNMHIILVKLDRPDEEHEYVVWLFVQWASAPGSCSAGDYFQGPNAFNESFARFVERAQRERLLYLQHTLEPMKVG